MIAIKKKKLGRVSLPLLSLPLPPLSVEIAKVGFRFIRPLALFPIANYDHMRLFLTLREPQIISQLGAHLSTPFYCGGGPLQ